MRNQYSKWALKALKTAEQTARACSHNYIGTEHILAGLLTGEQTTAGILLGEAGVTKRKAAGTDRKPGSAILRCAFRRAPGLYAQSQAGACFG